MPQVLTKLSGEIPLRLSNFDMERSSAIYGKIETHDDIALDFILEFKIVN